MLQVQCLKIPIAEGTSGRLREWVASLSGRSDEVRAALRAEGIADEAVFIGTEGDREFLYICSRAPDLARSAAAFQHSRLAVDVEFREIMAECLEFEGATALELLFAADSARAE